MPVDPERLLTLLERWADGESCGQPVPVEQLCADCPELADELRRQIAAHRWLEAVASPPPDETASDQYRTKTFFPDQGEQPVVPGYELLGLLGSGGMGVVYRARDTRLDRVVALKLVLPELVGPVTLARLRGEAQAVARLDHPHIVKLFEVGTCRLRDGGPEVPFLALELVPGGDLESRTAGRPLPPREAARVVALVARAIDHAHRRGVVHRDLKPSNILFAPPCDEPALNTVLGCPKVTDFGLARRAGGVRLTQTGGFVGTPAFAAPEQADAGEAGPPADIYSLGTVLYRLLSGRVPFAADSPIDLLYQVKHTPAPRIRSVCPEVPTELEAICLRCLCKRPVDRYTSASALADDLQRWLDGTPQVPQARQAPSRRRLPSPTLCGLVVLAILGVFAALGWLARPRSPSGPAEVAWDDSPMRASVGIEATRSGQLVRLGESSWRPLRAGDGVRVRVKLDRPGYVYIVWMDASGKPGPVYPWLGGDWRRRREEKPVRELSLPEGGADEVYRIESGPAGLETLLVLVRQSPLPDSVDLDGPLRGLGRRAADEERLAEVTWFEAGSAARAESDRGPDLKGSMASNDPLLRLREVLRGRLGQHFPYARAVTFGNLGGE